jgi:probable HAF family extracellular repeat protein
MKVLALLAVTLATVPAIFGAPLLRIDDLGSLGGSQMSGMAINASGAVAGYGLDASGNLHAFSSIGSPTDLTPGWAVTASAYGINGAGQVAGTTFADGHSQATLWSNGTAQVIGGLGGPDSYATAINDANQVAGMATTAGGQGRAVIYSAGGAQDVSLPGSSWASAYAINGDGAIAGYAMAASGAFQAYTWSPAGGYSSLGTLGGANSYAFGINDQGQVVGNSNTSSGYSHAFVWDSTGMHDLGTLGGASSYAFGINDGGEVVGYSSLAGSSDTHAFLVLNGVMFDLNSLVQNLAGWDLTEAYAINGSGQIAGTGLFDGAEHAFRLDVVDPAVAAQSVELGSPLGTPEPATCATVLMGLAILAGSLLLRRR